MVAANASAGFPGDTARWPPGRDLPMFKAWFRVDIHSIVVDIGDDDIEGEEL